MEKEELRVLLEEMTPGEDLIDSINTPAWHAHRKAERLEDLEILALLKEMIEEYSGKAEKEFRRNAYFVMQKILLKRKNIEYLQFFVDRLEQETDRYVLGAMLDGIGWLELPHEINIAAIIRCSRDAKWLVRHSAIHALRASQTEESREALRYWVGQQDEKKYKYELIYANAALGAVGTVNDVVLLEQHTHSRIRDIRDSAKYAIESIAARIRHTD